MNKKHFKPFLLGLVGGSLAVLAMALFSTSVSAAKWLEADYVGNHCQGKIEYRLKDTTRVDCLTNTHAIEYDFAHKWAEAIGQALHYAAMTGKKPGIVLIVDPTVRGTRYLARLKSALDSIPCVKIDLWLIESRI
tara:strand:- start:2 stop:406 length:405 start_codon:yes stop_codon:yes gene_type:complete